MTVSSLSERKRILIIDDHPLIRHSFATLLSQEPDLGVAGEAGNRKDAQVLLLRGNWDLVIVDLYLRHEYGIELIKDIRHQHPRLPVLAISCRDDETYVDRAFKAGANGFWHKSEGLESVITAVRKLLAGDNYLSAELAMQLFAGRGMVPRPSLTAYKLSDRELEVFELTGRGCSSREIASQLSVDIHTVETYRSRIKHKLGVPNAIALAARAGQWVAVSSDGLSSLVHTPSRV